MKFATPEARRAFVATEGRRAYLMRKETQALRLMKEHEANFTRVLSGRLAQTKDGDSSELAVKTVDSLIHFTRRAEGLYVLEAKLWDGMKKEGLPYDNNACVVSSSIMRVLRENVQNGNIGREFFSALVQSLRLQTYKAIAIFVSNVKDAGVKVKITPIEGNPFHPVMVRQVAVAKNADLERCRSLEDALTGYLWNTDYVGGALKMIAKDMNMRDLGFLGMHDFSEMLSKIGKKVDDASKNTARFVRGIWENIRDGVRGKLAEPVLAH